MSEWQPAAVAVVQAAESKLEDFAEDLGRLLGSAQAKAEGWIGQRNAITDQLTQNPDLKGYWFAFDSAGQAGGPAIQATPRVRRGGWPRPARWRVR